MNREEIQKELYALKVVDLRTVRSNLIDCNARYNKLKARLAELASKKFEIETKIIELERVLNEKNL